MLREEKIIVDRARQGDKEAFRRLVEMTQDRLYGLVYSLVSNREQAEDMTQEIFVKAYFALDSFEGHSSFFTWLHRIASNHCLDYLRKRRLDAISIDQPLLDGSDMTLDHTLVAPKSNQPDSALGVSTETAALLAGLEPDQRLLLTLREIEGHSYEELADILDCPVNTIKSRLNRAREALKATYLKIYGNIPDVKIVSESGEIP
jgi:RNA polymerase sigma-70 factor, ECF subfamily